MACCLQWLSLSAHVLVCEIHRACEKLCWQNLHLLKYDLSCSVCVKEVCLALGVLGAVVNPEQQY